MSPVERTDTVEGAARPFESVSGTAMADDERRAWSGVNIDDKQSRWRESSRTLQGHADDVFSPQPEDIWIAVMGTTGVGKSTFISMLVDDEVEIGHSLHSTTQRLGIYLCTGLFDRRVVLVDTPGFDDTSRSDAEILEEMAAFFTKLYQKSILLSGVLYLHRITDPKMSGSSVQNLELLKLMCGEDGYPMIRFVTTRWNELQQGTHDVTDAVKREQQLSTSTKFFKPVLEGGARLMRLVDTTQAAAKTVVSTLVEHEAKHTLQIQDEMLSKGLSLSLTSAGRLLDRQQHEQKRKFEREIKDIEGNLRQAVEEHDEDAIRMLGDEHDAYFRRRQMIDGDQRFLESTFEQLEMKMKEKLTARMSQLATNEKQRHAQSTQPSKQPVPPRRLSFAEHVTAPSTSSHGALQPPTRTNSSLEHDHSSISSRHGSSALTRGTLRKRRASRSHSKKSLWEKVEAWLWMDGPSISVLV